MEVHNGSGHLTAPDRQALPLSGAALLALGPAQVDVWVAFIDEAFEAIASRAERDVMSHDEWARLGRFVFEKDRRRYRVTRSLVRHALSRYLPRPARDWTFGATEFGRPFIANDDPAARSIRFNISHSDQVVMLAVTRDLQVGIDVEDLDRRVPLDAAASFFAADEMRQLEAMPALKRPRRFLDFWTLKESYIKARGEGLSLALDQFSFRLDREGPLGFAVDPRLQDTARRWSFWTWQPSSASVAALCLELAAETPARIQVRRTLPLVSEQFMDIQIQRTSAA